VQLVSPAQRAALAQIDLSALDGAVKRREARRLVRREAVRSFDLERGPLFRTTLLRLAEAEQVLLVAMHHVISDGWSVEVLMREAAEVYAAFSAGRPSPLPPLDIQYGDFCAWQREAVETGELAQQLAYWKGHLAGAAVRLDLPTDRPRGGRGSGHGAQRPVRVAPATAQRLRALARSRGATLYMGLLAAFQALLARYTRQDEVCVGTPVAGRTRREVEGLVGLFVNTLVMRGDLSGEPSFDALLQRVRETTLAALAHQDVPLEKLVAALAPERDGGRTPLFQVLFSLQNGAAAPARIGDATVRPLALDGGTAKFDLTLNLEEAGDGAVEGYLEYATELFDAPRMERMAAHFERLLAAVAADPSRSIHLLPMLAEAEREQLLVEWRGALRVHPPALVHELFERHAARAPQAWAVASAQGRLRYGELNRRANRLARRLQRLGAGPERRVALLLEPCVEMVLAVLAVLKAGAAYVPLDPAFPGERIALVLEEATAAAVLTTTAYRHLVPAPGETLVLLDDAGEAATLAALPASNLAPAATPGNVAYTIWTSGSTGRPKGVDVEHRQILNYLRAVVARFDLPPGASYAMLQPLAVDACNTVLIPALCHGGTLHVLPRHHAMDAFAVAAYFRDSPPDVLKIAPSHLAALLDASSSPDLLPRRALVLGGEASRREWIDDRVLPRAHRGSAVFIHYGPTETTVGVLTHRARPATRPGGPLVPLGRPLDNCAVYVLSPVLELLPVGAVGEIYVAGDNVARGYLARPALTAARFLPDPFSTAPGRRMYRSGDLARWLPDGSVEFLGRTDHQIKIRGFRVELGEVEATLAEHPRVERALVLGHERAAGDRRLVAYVLAPSAADEAQRAALARRLRDWLAERLPEYMVPAAVAVLAAFPVSPQGKVDPKALPDPDAQAAATATPRSAPATLTEARVAAVWEEVLGVSPVARDDDFFRLGGHSLLAVRLLGAIRQGLGASVSLADFLPHPTVARMAALLESETAADDASLVRLTQGGDEAPLYLAHPIGGSVACYVQLAHRLGAGQPVTAFQARRRDPRCRVDRLAAAYLGEVEPPAPRRLGGWSLGGLIAFEMAAQLEDAGRPVELLALLDTRPPRAPDEPPEDELPLLLRYAADVAGTLGRDVVTESDAILRLPPQRQQEVLMETLREAGLIQSDAELEAAFAVYAAHAAAADAYRPRIIAAPIDLFLAGDGDDRRTWPQRWAHWTTGGVNVHVVDADHHAVIRPPAVDAVAAQLRDRLAGLAKATADAAGGTT